MRLLFLFCCHFGAVLEIALGKMHFVIVRDLQRLDGAIKHGVAEEGRLAALHGNFHIRAEIKTIKHDIIGVFQHDFGVKHLTTAENVAHTGSQQLNTNALVIP